MRMHSFHFSWLYFTVRSEALLSQIQEVICGGGLQALEQWVSTFLVYRLEKYKKWNIGLLLDGSLESYKFCLGR